jgi:ATP phosphoribosyltransferase
VKKLGIPSPASRFHEAAVEVLRRVLPEYSEGGGDRLSECIDGLCVVGARGRDLPRLVDVGMLEAGLTGYDSYLEARLDGRHLTAWHIDSVRPSRLCLMARYCRAPGDYRCVLSEYPLLTKAWLRARQAAADVVIPMRGSIEGLVSQDRDLAGVATVVSGNTVRANGLVVCETLLESDMCLITSTSNSTSIEKFREIVQAPVVSPSWLDLDKGARPPSLF